MPFQICHVSAIFQDGHHFHSFKRTLLDSLFTIMQTELEISDLALRYFIVHLDQDGQTEINYTGGNAFYFKQLHK